MMGGFGAALAAWWFAVKTKVVEYDEGGPTTEDDPTKPDVPDPVPGAGKPPKGAAIPIAIGPKGVPEIDALLSEMDAYFQNQGVDTNLISAYEVTLMRKTPTNAVAIPPKSFWPRLALVMREGFMPLRLELGFPLGVGGYRPADYNAAVGGADASKHVFAEALDIRPKPGEHFTAENRRALALAGARLYLKHKKTYGMGFGVYGANTPSNIHIDMGTSKRYKRPATWRDAKAWIAKVQRIS